MIAISRKSEQSSLTTPNAPKAGTRISMEKSATEKVLFTQGEYEPQSTVNWRDVELLALDVDGVLTDGGLTFDDDGRLYQRFHVRDGFALVSAHKKGLIVAWISGRESEVARKRFAELKLDPVYCILNCPDKAAALREIQQKNNLKPHQCCFVGDDIPDLAAFSVCGVKVAVRNSAAELKKLATYITYANGGHGAVREVIEHILKAKGQWTDVVSMFSGGGGDLPERGDLQR
ncbi:MAG: HAD hydrolase family protein [Abditibacteriaceae bacterium]